MIIEDTGGEPVVYMKGADWSAYIKHLQSKPKDTVPGGFEPIKLNAKVVCVSDGVN